MSTTSTFAAALMILVGTSAAGQARMETVHLVTGKAVTGDVLEIGEDRIVIAQRLGTGSARHALAFDRIEPNSLYSVLVSALSPLDHDDHRRIGEIAFGAHLYATAARHLRDSIRDPDLASADLLAHIADAEVKDVAFLLGRSHENLDLERFAHARRLAIAALRRYPGHEATRDVPAYLDRITQSSEAARRRDEALARARRNKDAWERGERALADVRKWVDRALRNEVQALAGSDRFRDAMRLFGGGIKYLRNAERDALRLRQSTVVPAGLRPEQVKIEEDIVAAGIRIRLHVASLFTIRGSYGSALGYVNSALAYDPTDESALAARGRIEQAAASASARFVRR